MFQAGDDWVFLTDTLCNTSALDELKQLCQGRYHLEISQPFVGLNAGHTLFRQFITKQNTPNQVEDGDEDPLFGNSQQIVQKAMAYIRENYADQNLKLSNVADSLFVNYSYLSHVFKQKTGKTLSNYLLELRMEEAKNLLRYSGLSVSEISYRVGYPIPKNFYQAFKKYYNESPRSYQKRNFHK